MYPDGATLESSKECAKIERWRLFQGRPSGHSPTMSGAMEALAALTGESTMYTPYLFSKVVFVPFQAVMPPPQLRSRMSEDWIQAVPKP